MEGKRPRVLCAEKHQAMCSSISAALPDCEFTFTKNGADAFERARVDKFDLILLDCDLVFGSCAMASFIIRSHDVRTPLVFIGNHDDFTEEEARAADAQGIVYKDDADFIDKLKQRVNELIYGTDDLKPEQIKI